MALSGRKTRSTVIIVLLSMFVIFGTVMAFNAQARSGEEFLPESVEAVEVCMVNDKVFGEPQIPVEFEGKTYYGCCQGCVSRIKNDRAVRYSIDPLTGGEVDKATAFIVEGQGGKALYFESAQTAKQYSAKRAEHDGPVK